MARRSTPSGDRRGTALFIIPLVVLGLAVFVVALNIRHYSSMCDVETARDESLNRAAMERRIWALEKELLENSLLVEGIVRELDTLFGASEGLSVTALKILARNDAGEVGNHRGAQPPPPMPSYVRSQVASLKTSGGLQDVVLNSISSSIVANELLFEEMEEEKGADANMDGESGAWGGNPAKGKLPISAGWDWQEGSGTDDFLGSHVVEPLPEVMKALKGLSVVVDKEHDFDDDDRRVFNKDMDKKDDPAGAGAGGKESGTNTGTRTEGTERGLGQGGKEDEGRTTESSGEVEVKHKEVPTNKVEGTHGELLKRLQLKNVEVGDSELLENQALKEQEGGPVSEHDGRVWN